MIDDDDPASLKPLIDGGTEGFKGQARVILPTINSCYECSLDMFNKPTTFPICTIANTPRLPEHCIEWASVLEWPKVHGSKSIIYLFLFFNCISIWVLYIYVEIKVVNLNV